jgi:hypothetical protein
LTAGLLLALYVTGCGFKTPVIPPDLDLPKPVSGVQAYVRNGELLFAWGAPDEKRRAEIVGYKLFHEDAYEVNKSRCRCRKFMELAFVDLEHLDSDWIRNGKIELRLPVNPEYYGKIFNYVVVPVNLKGYAGPESEEISIHWLEPSPPPEVLQTESGDRSVLLRWETTGNHEEQTRFNIYRRPEGEEFPLAPVNPAPVKKNSFLDEEVQNGVCYYYQVRATVSHIPPWIESRESPEMKAVPADRAPPAPPQGVEVITGIGIVRLFWEENREADIEGYHIYRKVVKRGDFVQIGDIRHPLSIYTDEKVQAGGIYEYYVAAYDSSPLSNESRPSKIVKVVINP